MAARSAIDEKPSDRRDKDAGKTAVRDAEPRQNCTGRHRNFPFRIAHVRLSNLLFPVCIALHFAEEIALARFHSRFNDGS
jgi:hypothetical protein